MTKTRTGGCSFFAMAHRGWGPRRGETGVDPLGGRGRAEVLPICVWRRAFATEEWAGKVLPRFDDGGTVA